MEQHIYEQMDTLVGKDMLRKIQSAGSDALEKLKDAKYNQDDITEYLSSWIIRKKPIKK